MFWGYAVFHEGWLKILTAENGKLDKGWVHPGEKGEPRVQSKCDQVG
jgi:hypothetical protein